MEESQTQQVGGPRWFQRALPVTGLVLLLVGLAALFLPAVRDQVAVSTTRQDQPYAELFFTQTRPVDDAMCGRAGKGEVRFTVASHLEKRRTLAYRVVVAPTEGEQRTTKGTLRIKPGDTRQVRAQLLTPTTQDYTLTVRLPALDQQIRAHCSADRSGSGR
jgi:hypothetical protein